MCAYKNIENKDKPRKVDEDNISFLRHINNYLLIVGYFSNCGIYIKCICTHEKNILIFLFTSFIVRKNKRCIGENHIHQYIMVTPIKLHFFHL